MSPETLEVCQDDAIAHAEPSLDASVVRRLYRGELVQGAERVFDPQGNAWIRIQIGRATPGFVLESKVMKAGTLPQSRWRPAKIVRDERPLGVLVRGWGETLGATLNLRYLPLTRLGINLGIGAVLDGHQMKGRVFTAGIVSHPLLSGFSPFIEGGLTSLAYADGPSTLHILATYLTVGLEMMFDAGIFIAAGLCFVRSVDVELGYAWNDAHAGNTQPGSFGRLGKLMSGEVFQTIQPSVSLGYGF